MFVCTVYLLIITTLFTPTKEKDIRFIWRAKITLNPPQINNYFKLTFN